jgi:hypothetical protein
MDHVSSPETRLWGAFLLQMLRDIVPEWNTFNGGERLSSVSDTAFESMIATSMFRFACITCGLAPSTVVKGMNRIRLLEPTKEFKERHAAKYPRGGRSRLMRLNFETVEYYL